MYENYKTELAHKLWSLNRFKERQSDIDTQLGSYSDFYKAASESKNTLSDLIKARISTLNQEVNALKSVTGLPKDAKELDEALIADRTQQIEALNNSLKNFIGKNQEQYEDSVKAVFEAYSKEMPIDVPDKLQKAFDLGRIDRQIRNTDLLYKALDKQSGFEHFVKNYNDFFKEIQLENEVEEKIEENAEVIANSTLDPNVLDDIIANNTSEEIPQAIQVEEKKQQVVQEQQVQQAVSKANNFKIGDEYFVKVKRGKDTILVQTDFNGFLKMPKKELAFPQPDMQDFVPFSLIKLKHPEAKPFFVIEGKAYGKNMNTYENGIFGDNNFYELLFKNGQLFPSGTDVVYTGNKEAVAYSSFKQLQDALSIVEDELDEGSDVEITPISKDVRNIEKPNDRSLLIYAEANTGKTTFVNSGIVTDLTVIDFDTRIVRYLQSLYPKLNFNLYKKLANGQDDKQSVDYIKVLQNAGVNFFEQHGNQIKNLLLTVAKENPSNIVLFSNPLLLDLLTNSEVDLIVNKNTDVKLQVVPIYKLDQDEYIQDLMINGFKKKPTSSSSLTNIEAKKADIERRRQEELDSVDISKGGKIPIEGYEEFNKKINAKYDAEIAELEKGLKEVTEPITIEEEPNNTIANFLYEARPIKSFGSTDPVAAMKQFKDSHSDWVFPEISDKPTRKEVRKWFEIVYKQQQIFFLNRLKMQYPQTWLQELVKNIEVTKEVGGTTATFGNVQVNGDVDRYSVNINKEFVKQITGKNFSNTFPFMLHSIKGKNGVVLKSNGKPLTELTFEELVENGLSGTIHTNEDWVKFKEQHAKMIEALDTVIDGIPFSEVLTLNHEIYGKPYSEATYQQVDKENVYLTYEHNGNQYYILVDNPEDGFSEASGVYILDSNFKRINLGSKGIAIEAGIFEEIARANTNPKSPLNFRGKNLVSKRRITTSKGIEDRIHTNHIVGKTYTNVEALKQFLDSTIQDSSKEYTTEETVPDIYITIDNYKSDGQLRLDVTKSKGNKYQFSVKLSSVTGGNQTGTLNFSIDKTNKNILGTIISLIKSQGIKNQKLTGFTEDTKVQLTQKAPEWSDESVVFTSVINSLPLEYEVDRWIPVPLTQEVTDLAVEQKTELPLDSTNLEDLMVISNLDIEEIPTEEELDIPEQKTIEEIVFDLVKDKNDLLMVDNVFYTGIKDMREFFNNPKWYDKWLNDILSENKENVVKARKKFWLAISKKEINTKFLIPLNSPTTRVESQQITKEVNRILNNCL